MIKLLFFGSSLVEGLGASAPNHRFSQITATTLGWEEINLGLRDSTMTGRDDAGQIVVEQSGIGRVPDVLEAHPEIVFVLYGEADFSASRPIGSPSEFRQGTFYWDYDTAIRGLLYELKPDQIIISTIPYREDALSPNELGLTLLDYNAAIAAVAARLELRLLDPYEKATITHENIATLAAGPDGLNDAGHQRLSGYFIEELLNYSRQSG